MLTASRRFSSPYRIDEITPRMPAATLAPRAASGAILKSVAGTVESGRGRWPPHSRHQPPLPAEAARAIGAEDPTGVHQLPDAVERLMPGDPDVDADTLVTRTAVGNRLEESEDGHRRVRQHCGAHRPSRPTPPPTAPAAAIIMQLPGRSATDRRSQATAANPAFVLASPTAST
jgi:hypothetical protein